MQTTCKELLTMSILSNPVVVRRPLAARPTYLEMTPAMSRARVLNTIIPVDFEHVEAEEQHRQDMLHSLRVWSLEILGHPVHTQWHRDRFTRAYQGIETAA
jgi:hypothetical protein